MNGSTVMSKKEKYEKPEDYLAYRVRDNLYFGMFVGAFAFIFVVFYLAGFFF